MGRLSHAGRVLAMGFSFVTFGLGGLLMACLVVPVLRLYPGTQKDRDLRVQRCVCWSFKCFVGLWWLVGLSRVTTRGTERLAAVGPCIIVPNHPTLIDVVVLISLLPQADCIVKRALWRNRYLGGAIRGIGYIPNDAQDVLVAACVERLAAGRRLVLFPEGTRSPHGGIGQFKRGAAHVSLASGCPIVPVVITCEPLMLGSGVRWYQVPRRRAHLTIEFLEPVFPEQPVVGSDERRPAAARRLTAALRSRIEQEVVRAR